MQNALIACNNLLLAKQMHCDCVKQQLWTKQVETYRFVAIP